MPHLDANALTTDLEGLSFLQDVLGTPARAPVRHAFDAARPTKRMKRILLLDVDQLVPRRQKGAVPEAA